MMKELYIAVTCSSNMNRSMEAHAYLKKKGFKVQSFGTGDRVRLPGFSRECPNNYDFGTPYSDIYQDLVAKDKEFYTQNGLLSMLDRNRRIKNCPERFQDSTEMFDVIITCEERVFDQVIGMFISREPVIHKVVHVVNVEIEDNPEEATIGAFLISDIVTRMEKSQDLSRDIDNILHYFEVKFEKAILYCTMSY